MAFAGRSAIALLAACLASTVASAQDDKVSASFSAPHGFELAGTRNYLGSNLGRGFLDTTQCASTVLFCDSRDRSSQLYAGTMFSKHWGAELGYLDTGRVAATLGESRTQGLSLSLVARTRILDSLAVFGKVGTAYGRSDTSVMGNSAAPGAEQSFGLAYGGGLSWNFSPRLSATFEWGSYDLRLPGGPVRSTSLGLKYSY